MPKITVIMPAYNAERTIEESIGSVVRQTFPDWELLVVNDGSKDGTAEIVEAVSGKDPRVKLLSKENGGVSSARNFGIENATGEFLAFLDADDMIDPDMYEVMLQGVDAFDADIAQCGTVSEKKYSPLPAGAKPFELQGNSLVDYDPGLKGMVMRRSTVGDIRFSKDLQYCEDLLFGTEVLLNARRLIKTPTVKVHYIQIPNSLSWQDGDIAIWQGFIRARKAIMEKVQASPKASEELKQYVVSKYYESLFSIFRFCIKYRKPEEYAEAQREYGEVLEKFLATATDIQFLRKIEYKTYIASYGVASWVHYYPKIFRK